MDPPQSALAYSVRDSLALARQLPRSHQ
eukprot:COSAG02_NODE_40554_length_404_cov_0.836066_1_plen_27_part_10